MNLVVVGAQWGDEGKGKVVDLLGQYARFIVRYQGGNNAGHTVVVNGKKTVLHLIPSGVLHPGKTCLIANGVVFNPSIFFEEIESLIESNAFSDHPEKAVMVSERAHVIMPYHIELDRLREEKAGQGKGKIGTTVRGIGPAYEDKVARRGIQVIDLFFPNLLREKLERALEEKNILFKNLFNVPAPDFNSIYNDALKIGERLKPFVKNTRQILWQALEAKEPILFEGAQGVLLDVDHGTYPYVTSSNTTSSAALTGSGLGAGAVSHTLGITKAYTTRVGTGPFPTEIEKTEPTVATKIREEGAEYGATTGRPRRCGWLDLVALKYATEVNNFTGLALMKIDVLSNFKEIKVCTSYMVDSKQTTAFPSCLEDMENAKPVFETLPGWGELKTRTFKTKKDLPKELLDFISKIETTLKIPVQILSYGPGREETLVIENPLG